ncbi:MAG: gacS2, partial [Symbiobacteriaceae bacterium]|nr:gacS2 [Symbiobacteriaceae bacterium]
MVNRFPLGVRGKLLALVLVLLLPVLMLNTYGVYARYQTQVHHELDESQALAEAVSSAMVNFLDSLWSVELATGLAIAVDKGAHTTEDLNAYLEQQLGDQPTVNAVTWVAPDGAVVASTSPRMRGLNVADREYFQRALAGEQYIVSDVLVSRATGAPSIIVARRIELDGRFFGVAAAGVNLERLQQVLPPLTANGRRFSFIDRTGKTIYDSDQPNQTLPERVPHLTETVSRALLGETVLTPSFTDPATGERRMGVTMPIPALGWAFSSSVPHRIVMADVRNHTMRDLLVLLMVATLSTLVALYLSRSILRPVLALQKAARAISTGDLGARVALAGRDEVAAAAQTFNSMANRVQSADEVLRSRVTAVAHLSRQALQGAKTEHLAGAAAAVVALSLGAEAAEVLELHPNTETVRVLSAVGVGDGMAGRTMRTGYKYLAAKVLPQPGPVVLDDLAALLGSEEALLGGVQIRTAAAATIHGNDAPFGVLAVASAQQKEFSQADLHFLHAVANVVSTAIQRNRTQFVEAFLARAGKVLSDSLDPDETLSGLAELATDHLADWCIVDLLLGGRYRRVVRTGLTGREETARALERWWCGGTDALVTDMDWADAGQPHIRRRVTDEVLQEAARGDEEFLALLRSLGMVSAIMVPLVARGNVIGSIWLLSCEPAGYDAHDVELAEELAGRAALTLDHIDMYASLRLLARQQAATAELGQTLIAGAGLATVLTEGVAMVQRELGVLGCRILETQPDGSRLRIRTGPEWTGGVTIPIEVPPEGLTPMGYTLRTGIPVIIQDVNAETRFAMPPEVRRLGVVSGACAVIPGTEEPYGVIAVYTDTPRTFTQEEMNFLMAVASLVSQAVQHERDQKRLHTQHAVARILAEAGDTPDTIHEILQTLGEGLEWDVGFFWVMDEASQSATVEQVWHIPGLHTASFVEACRGFTARKSEGLIGRTWTRALPDWIPNL